LALVFQVTAFAAAQAVRAVEDTACLPTSRTTEPCAPPAEPCRGEAEPNEQRAKLALIITFHEQHARLGDNPELETGSHGGPAPPAHWPASALRLYRGCRSGFGPSIRFPQLSSSSSKKHPGIELEAARALGRRRVIPSPLTCPVLGSYRRRQSKPSRPFERSRSWGR